MEKALLSVRKLHKEFDGNTILKSIDLDVNRGEVIVIIGPSGCGKSTFLRCLNGFSSVRQKIGMVFQSYDLFPHKTVLENILLAPVIVQKRKRAETEAEAMALLEKVGLADRKNDYPRQLSGGQKQRIAIVRALIMHPEVLLLDEITAALDPEMVHEVLQVVLNLAKNGSTMLIVTHEMTFAKAIADRVLFLEHGEIAEESRNPKAFFEMPGTERARQFLKSFEYESSIVLS